MSGFGRLFSRQKSGRADNQAGGFVKEAGDVSSVVEIKYQSDDNNDSKGYDFKPFVNELIHCLNNHGGEVVLRLHNEPYHSAHYFRVEDKHIVTIPIQSPALITPTIQKLEKAVAELGYSAIKVVNLGLSHNQSTKVGQFFDAGIKQAADLEMARQMCQTAQAKMAATQSAKQDQPVPTSRPSYGLKIR